MTRLLRICLVLLVAGTGVAALAGGPDAATGFAIGAGFSILNVRVMHRVVESLGTETAPRGAGVFMALRLMLLGAMLYVIVRYLDSGLPAALCGLFTGIVAVIVDSIYQHIYGTAS